jgi:beta-glucosidase
MIKKISLFLSLCTCIAFGQPESTIDTVLVTPVFLKLVSVSNNVYKYVGKATYQLVGWSYDRFNASLSIIKDGTGDVVPLTGTKGDGFGSFSRWGAKGIFFTCQFNGAPSGTYKAKVTVATSRSDTATFIYNKVTSLDNGSKQTIINGGSAGGVPGTAWQDGPYGDRGGYAYPCGEAMASTFDTAIAEEGGIYKGEDFRGLGHSIMLGTTMNLVRDSRGGRSFESYGEDPYLQGKMAAADCRGCSKAGLMVTCKHFCCNNEERARGNYPVWVSERSLRELYTYHFGMAAAEGPATGFMTAYNAVNGFHNAQSKHTITDIIKNSWGMKGFFLTDWDNGGGNATANALAGLDLPTPNTWGGALAGMVGSTITQGFFDDKAFRWIWARYMTHCFEPGYSIKSTYHDSIDNTTHYNYERRATRKAMILAKNEGTLLPLSRSKAISIAVVGTYANDMQWFIAASSQVNPMHHTSASQAIKKIGGLNVTVTNNYQTADYAVVCIGPVDGGEGTDRVPVSLPDSDNQLCAQVLASKPGKTIVFYEGGSTADSGAWNKAPAIIMEFFAGEDHTLAMAEVLFGDYNPAGRIPMTFPADSTQLPRFGITPPWENTGMSKDFYEDAWEGRGYPYYDYHKMTPLFCFGHGLSYTTFEYGNLQITPQGGYPGDTFTVKVDVKNSGIRDGEEVVQLYLHDQQSNLPRRYKDLRGFSRVPLAAGETKTVTFGITERDMEYYNDTLSDWVVEPGPIDVLVGASSLDIRQKGTITLY